MFEMVHTTENGIWSYRCPTVAPLQGGGGRTLAASRETAEHHLRQHLSRTMGRTVSQQEARRQVRHRPAS